MKTANQRSPVSVENSQTSSSKNIIEVMHKWVNVRVTMDSGAAGHVTPEGMFPYVKLDRITSPWRFVEANGRQTRHLGQKTLPFETIVGIQRFETFRSASVVKPLFSVQKVGQTGNIVVLDEKNPHKRNTRDGTMIKLDANNGVCTDMWILSR